MNNVHLFELINAPPGLDPLRLLLATGLAQWAVYPVALVLGTAWVRGDRAARAELLQLLTATLFALAFTQAVSHAWPQPRPFALHLGTQYLAYGNDPGLPSGHTTALWALAVAALGTRCYAVWGFPLLALGLVVGLSRVYLGVHFPFDIGAALPVAVAGALVERALRGPLRPLLERGLDLYDRLALAVHTKLHWSGKA
jgi:undecaprenyl-diphosphatase